MKTFTLVIMKAWFSISYAGVDDGMHVYLLENKKDGIHLAVRQDKPLPYQAGNIRISGTVECTDVQQFEYAMPSSGPVYSKHMYCNSIKIKEEPCDPNREGIIVGGKVFC